MKRSTPGEQVRWNPGVAPMLRVRRKQPDALPWLLLLAFVGLWLGWDYPDPSRKTGRARQT